ncbi:single-stranded DNA-binding protein [Streptacidiphilus anmyonensis]|uniref:single-stranded DNA-binding protein n=1 Tax=Streptacidiphilus anmyonensis TaxID=405782 RepID=UPI0007C74022|nr:single-stranded DNA-binding protein [Streptacidiphilus anmyonensis]
MMNGTMVTLVGVAVSQVRYATTVGGVPVAHFRLAATERRFDRPRQVWVEGDTSYFTVWAWRSLAENALTSIGCGDPLLVTGRMRVREWERPDGQSKGVSAEIEATALGHDLARGTTVFRRTLRGRPELVASASERNRIAEQRRAPARGERPPAAEGTAVGKAEGSGVGSGVGKVVGEAGGKVLALAAAPKAPSAASAASAGSAGSAMAEEAKGRSVAAAAAPPGPA